jgi:hypothetical protein
VLLAVGFDGDADAVVVALRPRAVALDGANVVALVVEKAPRADVLAELFVVEARGAAGGCVVGAAEQPRGRRVGRDGGLVAHGESDEGEGEEGLHMILFGCCAGGEGQGEDKNRQDIVTQTRSPSTLTQTRSQRRRIVSRPYRFTL